MTLAAPLALPLAQPLAAQLARGIGNPILALPNLAAYFKFNTGITVTGAGVSQWSDQSGNGRHLLQATDTYRPALQADGSILFDGADNYLKCNAFTLNQPETIYLRLKQVTWTTAEYFCDGNATATGAVLQAAAGSPASPQIELRAGGVIGPNSDLAIGSYGVVCAVINGASSVLVVDSGAAVTGNAGASNMGG